MDLIEMAGLRLITAFLTLGVANSALADTCVIVFAVDRPHWEEIYWHEIAHCNGWVHPEIAAPKPGETYRSFVPPRRYVHLPSMPVITHAVTTAEAEKLCGGHWGCQRFQ